MKEPVLLPPTHDSLLSAFRTYLTSLGLSSISRKLYSADIARLLSSSLLANLTLTALSNPKTYLTYLTQPELSGSTTLLRRNIASLKQFGLFLSHSFSISNPTQNLSLSTNQSNLGLSTTSDKYIKACIQYLKENHLSESSLRSYKSDITQYLTYLESHYPSTHINTLLNEKNLQIYADMLTHLATQSPATIERKLKTIRRFINWHTQSTPRPVMSDNIKIAANYQFSSPLTNAVPASTSNPADQNSDTNRAHSPSPDHPHISVKNVNYRKFRLPTLRSFISMAILLILVSTLSIFSYRQFGRDASLTAAFPNTPVTPNRQLSFQGRLENASGTPITSATNFVFKLFDASSGGTELYSSGTCSITPDTDGVFSTQIGGTCGSGISSSVFTENADVWLEVTVAAETLTPRQQIATVAYALNSETLQGFPISATVSAIRNTVVPMNQWGEIIVGEQSPRLTGVAGTFQISAPSLSLVTATGTNGNITLAPDGTGQVNLNGNTTTTNFFNVSNAQLTTGSLITGTVANNNSGFKLIDLLSGSSPTSKFSVTDTGLSTVGADLYVSSGVSLYNNAVSDDTFEGAKFCTGDGETNCVTDFSTLVAGSGYWTQASGVLYPTTTTNDFAVGGTSLAASIFGIDESAGNFYLGYDNSANPTLNFEATDADAGTFGFNTNDSFYFTGGNVGIGLVDPVDSLTVANGTAPAIRIGTGSTDNGLYIGVPDSNEGVLSFGADFAHSGGAVTSWTARETTAGILRVDNGTLTYYGDSSLVDGNTFTPTERLTILSTGSVGIGDTSPSKMFVVGNGDLFQVDSSGNVKGPTLALGTGTIAPTDRLFDINTSTALTNATTYTGTIQRTLTGTLTGNISNSIGLYNGLTINATDGPYSHIGIGTYNSTSLSNGNTIDAMRGIYSSVQNNSTTLSPDTGTTATNSAAVRGDAANSAAGIITNQYGGEFISYNNSTGSITNARGVSSAAYNNNATGTITTAFGGYNLAYTNVDGASITTAYGTYGGVNELAAQTTGGITTGYGGYFASQDATTSYGLYAEAIQNTANTETFTNAYGIRNDCESNGANITITNCYGIQSTVTETAGTITNGFGGYFSSAATMGTGYGVYSTLTGASPTSYGVYSNVTGAGTTNYGLYSNVSGAGTNWALYTNGSADSYFGGDITLAGGNLNTGNIPLVLGDATTDTITLTTDGTGNGEIVLPNDVIGPNEIFSTGQTDEYCLTYEGTGTTWEWQTCGSGGSGSNWRYNLGTLSPLNDTVDLLIGGNATSSAKISFININSGTPTINLANQASNLAIRDNTASAFRIVEGANTYLDITTTDNTESFSLNLPSGGATSLTANLFTSNIAKTINIGTGTTADTINIGTGGTTADTIIVGNTASTGSLGLRAGTGDITLLTSDDIFGYSTQTSGNVMTLGVNSAVTVAGSSTPLQGLLIDLASNYTTTNDDTTGLNVTLDTLTDSDATQDDIFGLNISGGTLTSSGGSANPVWIGGRVTLPATTNTDSSATGINLKGFDVVTPSLTQTTAELITINGHDLSSAGALVQNTNAGTINWRGANIVLPTITQTTGTINADGLRVLIPASSAITTGGTMNALNIVAPTTSGPAAGSLNGLNIGNLTSAGSATEYALNIGTGWDANLNFVGAGDINIVDNSTTALTISEATNNYLLVNTDNTNTVVTLDLPTAGGTSTTGNLFTSNIAKTINLGTGTAADTINIGTGGTTADSINIGGLSTTLTSVTGNATVSGNLTTGGQLQLGRFSANPTAIGAGTMIFDTTLNVFKCYNGTSWFNCGGTLFSNTNASVADGSYITVTHNLASNDLLSSAWINAQGVWKSLEATYQPAIAWEGKDTQKGNYHNQVNSYIPQEETGTGTSTLHEGLVFDTFEDATKTDSANTTVSTSTDLGDDGSSNYATLNQRVQDGRVGLMGGQTLDSATTDNDGQTYLGSNTVNDTYYYDRSKDSTPEVLVELGIDPNWYNGVTLSVATSSATYSQAGTLADKNPNLTTSYNGSLIKATGTDSTPRTIYITIKSPTTFDWTNYQGDSATGVTITPGTAQTLGSTGVSVTFTGGVNYNTGDVFKIASWYIEAEGTNRGAKQQFPERSYVVATASSVDIIDADTQKLWIGFDQGTSYAIGVDTNNNPSSAKALNGEIYISQNGSAATGLYTLDFVHDSTFKTNATDYRISDIGIAGRNAALAYNVINTSTILVNITANDVDAAVIPNHPTKEVTVSGWGYIATSAVQTLNETVNLPYKFNGIPQIVTNINGAKATTAPSSLSECTSEYSYTGSNISDVTTNSFLVNLNETNGGVFSAGSYICYTWTATGTVSPKQFVAVAATNGATVINETDGIRGNHMTGQTGIVKAVFAGNALYLGDQSSGSPAIQTYYGVPKLVTTEGSNGATRSTYYTETTIPALRPGDSTINSLHVTQGTSTIDGTSNTVYVGTDAGLTVIQENQVSGSQTSSVEDGNDPNLARSASVKYYTKDYVSEEMVGDIRGMWPMNYSSLSTNTTVTSADISIKANSTTTKGAGTVPTTGTSGVRGTALTFDGGDYLCTGTTGTCADDADLDFAATDNFSAGAWVKTSSSGNQYILMKYDGGNAYWAFRINSGTASTTIRDSGGTTVTATSSVTANDDKWHHVVIVRDVVADQLKLYQDGVLVASTADTTTNTFANTGALGIGVYDASGTPANFFNGVIDEVFVTATALTPAQIKNMYQVGYRALQSHGTGLSSGTADGNQALAGASNNIGVVAPDYNNQFLYVGSNHTTDGALTKIELNSDTAIKNWDTGDNDPDGGAQIVDDDITSLAVGETLYAVGSAASGIKSMGIDNNATATTGNFVSKTYTLPKNIGSAVLWASPILDASDGSNTLTVKASNDGGSTYATCTLVNTNSNPAVPEKEYACTFSAADNDLKVKFEFARGTTKTNTYVVQYGISWLGETGFRVEQVDNNNTRLYNFSGESQNLKLNVTGASTTALASPWTDAGSYLYPTGYEDIRVYNGAGSNYLALSDTYINFGSTSGSSGYGIRDNAGTMEFKNSAGSWTAIGATGASWWDQTSGTIQPYNKTVDFLLGGTATSSAKFAVLNMNSGTPTASISGNMIIGQGDYLGSEYGPLNIAYKSGANAWTTGLVLQDSTGNVGIGVSNPTQKLEVNGYVVGQRFEDSASSAYYLDPAATGTSLSIDGNIVGNGAFYLSTGNDAVAVSIGTTGAGKLDAGTIDPPYTINGEKFATYMSSMTGVKEETTGSVSANEFIAGKGYRATLDFANALKGSDLWLFSQTSNLQSHLDDLVVLTTAAGMGKTWYEMDAASGRLYLYAQSPTRISYRLTAPRFDAATWTNTRDSESLGFVIERPTTWSVSDAVADLYNQISDTISHTLTSLLSVQTISPLAEGQAIEITAPVTIAPTTQNPDLPTLVVDGEIEATTISARLAQLESIQAENITAKNIVADTIAANSIIGLDAKIASLSAGLSDEELGSITDRIKARLAELTDPATASDVPAPTENLTLNDYSLSPISTSSADLSAIASATADIDFVTINDYLAVIGSATITDLSITNNLYASTLSSQTSLLSLQPSGGIINLASSTLIVDSSGTVVINGDLYVSGKILANSANLNNLELGNAPESSSSSALGNLLAIYNEAGQTVATIDASGSANLASLTTNMITIATANSATDSSALATLTGNAESNSTAGNATLFSPETELTITSPYVTANSLVYLTPTTNTDNKVLFVKSKESCTTSSCSPSFTVGIDAPASTDISFNWWIIELK